MPYHDDDDPETLHFSLLTYIFLAVFLFFMPLLLINLLIGLAVGDIAAVQRHAEETSLETQVSFHARMEERIPFLRKLMKDTLEIYPNRSAQSLVYQSALARFKLDPDATDRESQIDKELTKQKLKIKELTFVCETTKDMVAKLLKKMDISLTEAEESSNTLGDAGSMDDITSGFLKKLSATNTDDRDADPSELGSARPSRVAQFYHSLQPQTFSTALLTRKSLYRF